MKAPKIETGMVRGYVVTGDRYTSCIGKDQEGCITAYTFWYRHDEDLTALERELEDLCRVYSRMKFCTGYLFGYETKEYKS